MSIRDVLMDARARLEEVSLTPRLDAELLLAAVLDCDRTGLIRERDAPVDPSARQRFDALIDRRLEQAPVAYLTGRCEFWSLPLQVSPAVLVPRADTECLVEAVLDCLNASDRPRVADLGTGSGAIALALASERPDAAVVATDVSSDALDVARCNAAALGLESIDWRCGDWFAPIAAERFDLIVSNPPYVAPGDPHLAALVQEPESALVAADAGFACLDGLIDGAPSVLLDGGWLWLEHGAEQGEAVRQRLSDRGFGAVQSRRDLAGNERATGGQWHG